MIYFRTYLYTYTDDLMGYAHLYWDAEAEDDTFSMALWEHMNHWTHMHPDATEEESNAELNRMYIELEKAL